MFCFQPKTLNLFKMQFARVIALPSLMLFGASGLKYQKYVLDCHGRLFIHLDLPTYLCHYAENINNDKDMLIKGFRCPKRQLNSKLVKT